MVYRGHVKDGMVVLDDGVTLSEGIAVRIDVVDDSHLKPGGETGPTLYERLEPLIGKLDDLPSDASLNVDHYLYGHPKK